MDTIRSLKVF